MRPLHSALYDLLGSNCYLPTFFKMTMKKMSDITRKVIISFASPPCSLPLSLFLILPRKCVKKPKKNSHYPRSTIEMIFFSLLILPRVLCIIRVKSTVIVRILMCKCKTSLCVYAHYNRIWWKKGWFVIKTASQKKPSLKYVNEILFFG